MPKEAAITVRVPMRLKRQLEVHAHREKRSLSSQITTYLERSVEKEKEPVTRTPRGRLLGLYEGTPVPSERDFALVRRLLWGSLGKRRARRGT